MVMLQSQLLAIRNTNHGQRSGLKRFSTFQINNETPGVIDEAADVSKKPSGVSRMMMTMMMILILITLLLI